MRAPLRVAVLLSGAGLTLENLFEAIEAGALPARIETVLASRPDAGGLERARRRGVPARVVPSRDFRPADAPRGSPPDWDAFSRAVFGHLEATAPDLVCLAGFLCYLRPRADYAGRIMNIHPALLPAFGGRGMYGRRVHEAVAAAGVKVSGCTVHFVDEEYDAGPIILQRTCPVYASDTAEAIAARVFAEECVAYPEAIRLYAAGRLRVEGRRVHVLPEGEEAP